MIENASSMDRPVAAPGRFTRPRVIALIVVAVAVVLAAIAFPSVRRWSRADRAPLGAARQRRPEAPVPLATFPPQTHLRMVG